MDDNECGVKNTRNTRSALDLTQSQIDCVESSFQSVQAAMAEAELDAIALRVFLKLIGGGHSRGFAAKNAFLYAEAFLTERAARRAGTTAVENAYA